MDINSRDLLAYAKIARYVATDNLSGELYFEGCKVLDSAKQIANRGPSFQDIMDYSPHSAWFIQAVCVEYDKEVSGKELVVAYRGSSNVQDWTADVGIANVCLTPTGAEAVRVAIERFTGDLTWWNFAEFTALIGAWGINGVPACLLAMRLAQSLKYFEKVVIPLKSSYQKVVVVGHSLGAFLASHVAYKNALCAYAFDGPPGVKYTLVKSKNEIVQEKANQIFNHRLKKDPVSCVGLNTLNILGISDLELEKDDFMLDSKGFPYGHIGYITNWEKNTEETLVGWKNHDLDQLILTNFDNDFCLGTSLASTTEFYW